MNNYKNQSILLSGILLHLIQGQAHIWGNLKLQIFSQARLHDPNIKLDDTQQGMVLNSALSNILKFAGPFLMRHINVRILVALSLLIFQTGLTISIFSTDLHTIIISYNLSLGLATAVGFMVPIQCACELMPENKGLATSIVFSAFGLSPLLFNQVVNYLINPNQVSPIIIDDTMQFDEDISRNYPYMMTKLLIIQVVMGIIGIMLLQRKPIDNNSNNISNQIDQLIVPHNFNSSNVVIKDKIIEMKDNKKINSNIDLSLVISSPIQLLSQFISMQSLCIGVYISNMQATIGQMVFHQDVNTIQQINIWAFLFNSIARLLVGFIFDQTYLRISYRSLNVIFLLIGLAAVLALTYLHDPTIQIIGNITMLFFLGGTVMLPACFLQKMLGPQAGSEAYGLLTTGYFLGHLSTIFPKQLYECGGQQQGQQQLIMSSLFNLCIVIGFYKANDHEYGLGVDGDQDRHVHRSFASLKAAEV